jgi:hypothetical protein
MSSGNKKREMIQEHENNSKMQNDSETQNELKK